MWLAGLDNAQGSKLYLCYFATAAQGAGEGADIDI